jgi:hypothetical protein
MTSLQKMLFSGVLKYENRYDFDILFEKSRLLEQQERLQLKYEKAKQLNDELLNSSSWKATEYLRSLKRNLR